MGKRNVTVSSRFSPAEVQELDRRRGKVRRGTFLRNIFLGKKEPRQIPGVNREIYVETARWAANLNQIAMRVNVGDYVDVDEILCVLKHFRLGLLGLTGGGGDDSENQ